MGGRDLNERGRCGEDLTDYLANTKPMHPRVNPAVRPSPSASWPAPLGEAALPGIVGEIVRTIAPHTEADPALLVLHLLVAFGNYVGRGPHFAVSGARHRCNLNLVAVGRTSEGRKGTAWSAILPLLERLDPEWAGRRPSGLSTGEGLIHAVRDPSERPKGRGPVSVDEGVSDKRLLIVETELGGTLRAAARECNTLSAVIRQAWDGDPLQTMTRNNPLRATGAHVSIVGHITDEELHRYLGETDVFNGFSNRMIWACSRRSKLLPTGGSLVDADFNGLAHDLRQVTDFARSLGDRPLVRDAAAESAWGKVYGLLATPPPGRAGVVLGRAAPQVLRLALVYALLDRSEEVRLPHLAAALEVWRFCEDSTFHIFGNGLADSTMDEILEAISHAGSDGITRTDLWNLFSRHRKLTRSLDELARLGLVHSVNETTGGRPVQRWFPGPGAGETSEISEIRSGRRNFDRFSRFFRTPQVIAERDAPAGSVAVEGWI